MESKTDNEVRAGEVSSLPYSFSAGSFEIAVENVLLHGHHGVFEQERKVGNDFEVTLRVRVAATPGMERDELAGTISYADLFEVVREEFMKPSRLLEHLAIRISQILRKRWNEIQCGEIKIVKLQPPIGGINGKASVKYFF